ncbi:MAG: AtpZ/AtpI family protein [Candidatus Marinimicrobia bacterium]|jgi:ATP synthase protein I|nr:F0F1 ATP synthase assembly protein I [Candidatus Neomarinimicrobiota bacterium]MDP6457364.1 AtpZ/AtpI family protein [Candidatus Neomarinimicrobiota bacterium]MDP6593514.1 AtpZ/AtpI family protein [Candidatus Neomarinimicrobiota bacterium]MDP6836324.1 AtpZ/AtpI family protein [Candidatus Neomarinimicrobiota bacterium]MDP6966502.1 AtpZ/AtpI family protein [Candidatus Neomarinimicrobiota bacterium]|tara:strand:- start:9633 stop:9872 length:240 start_codon:yes stop_codon:yes gene_type:complete
MPADQSFLAKVAQIFSRNVHQSGPYIAASYTLIGAIIGLSLAGYFLDKWLDTSPWLLIAGLIIGLVIGFYEMAKVVFRK